MASPLAHAYLSPSSAHRFLNCPPILQFEAEYRNETSAFAEEGTEAHSLAEFKLQDYLTPFENYDAEYAKLISSFKYYDQEMEEATEYYLDLIIEQFNGHENGRMELEVRVDISPWVPESFGSSDVVIISDGVIEIIDLKYGKGVPVDAHLNPQLMLYALGAYNAYDMIYDFDKIKMTVVQPRLDNLSSFEIEVEELLYWANNYVAPRAVQAFEGTGEWNLSEDVLRFSPIRAQIRPRAEMNFKVIDDYIEEETLLLEPQEIAEILERSTDIKKWIEQVESYALDQALNKDVEFPGFKVVEGRSNRVITDPIMLEKRLAAEGYSAKKYLKPKALIAMTGLEKLVGKKQFSELAEGLIIKPAGKPTLAKATDKRPALNSVQSAIDDFS